MRGSNLSGRTIGNWSVIRKEPYHERSSRKREVWLCRCKCGTKRVVLGQTLRNGQSASCGCIPRRPWKHGATGTKEHHAWTAMIQRCRNPNHPSYHNYGERGIDVCKAWEEFASFFKDVGLAPTEGHTIERVNNDKGYEPGNVIWATRAVQGRNTRNCRLLEFNGERKPIAEWARLVGISPTGIAHRIDKLKWTVAKALSTSTDTWKTRRSKRLAKDDE